MHLADTKVKPTARQIYSEQNDGLEMKECRAERFTGDQTFGLQRLTLRQEEALQSAGQRDREEGEGHRRATHESPCFSCKTVKDLSGFVFFSVFRPKYPLKQKAHTHSQRPRQRAKWRAKINSCSMQERTAEELTSPDGHQMKTVVKIK